MRISAPLILSAQQSSLLVIFTEVTLYVSSRSTFHQGLVSASVCAQEPSWSAPLRLPSMAFLAAVELLNVDDWVVLPLVATFTKDIGKSVKVT